MSRNWTKRNMLPYGLLIYNILCIIVRKVAGATSPFFYVFTISILILPLTLMLLNGMKKGVRLYLNVLFICLFDIVAVIACMNIIVMEGFPTYLKAHEKFFDSSIILGVGMFLASAIVGVIIVNKYGKLGR